MTKEYESQGVKTIQAIIIMTDEQPNPKELVMAGMTVLHQYNPASPNFVGQSEADEFKKHWDSWIKENEMRQEVYVCNSYDDMTQIEYQANMESIPLSIFGNGEKCLVLGPFNEEDIERVMDELVVGKIQY